MTIESYQQMTSLSSYVIAFIVYNLHNINRMFNLTCRDEWEWLHRTALGQQSQVSDDFKHQLTAACKQLLNKMGEYRRH